MKFSEKFKKNKSEAVETETAQDFGKKKHKPDPKKLVGTISKKHIKNGTYSMAMAAVVYRDRGCDQYDRRGNPIQIFAAGCKLIQALHHR